MNDMMRLSGYADLLDLNVTVINYHIVLKNVLRYEILHCSGNFYLICDKIFIS